MSMNFWIEISQLWRVAAAHYVRFVPEPNTDQSVQSQRQVYKKGETKSIMCRFAKKCYILESDV